MNPRCDKRDDGFVHENWELDSAHPQNMTCPDAGPRGGHAILMAQYNQGDSLNSLPPGINGPTSKAAVKNADNNLKQILAYISSDPDLAANTDILPTTASRR